MRPIARTRRPLSRYLTLIFLTSGLLSCSHVPTSPAKYPVPPLPSVRPVEIRSVLPVDGEEVRIVDKDGKQIPIGEARVVIAKASRWRFVNFRTVLLNDQATRNFIQIITSDPRAEALETPPVSE